MMMNMSLYARKTDSRSFLSKPEITQFLEHCLQPESKNKMEQIFNDIWNTREKYKQEKADITLLGILFVYVLDYVYKQKEVSVLAVSRSLYSYLKLMEAFLLEQNRDGEIIFNNQLLTEIGEFTNFDSSEGKNILMDAVVRSVRGSKLGLIEYLIKFGFAEVPTEANDAGRIMLGWLIGWLNHAHELSNHRNSLPVRKFTVDYFLNYIKHSKIGFRRCIFLLFCICIIFHYHSLELREMMCNDEERKPIFCRLKMLCIDKLKCLNKLIEATPETYLTLKDIQKFQEIFADSLPNRMTVSSFLEVFRKIFSEAQVECKEKLLNKALDNYNPRLLKDLARCKIRKCLQSSKILPQDVYQLGIPDTLKEFLLFHQPKGILKLLKEDEDYIHVLGR